MLRSTTALAPNRSLIVLVALLLIAVAGIAAVRDLTAASFAPVAPLFVPAEDPAPIAPAVEMSSAPIPNTGTRPGLQTAAPAQATPNVAAPTGAPQPIVPVGPATTAAPGRGIPAVAPEDGLPAFTPPPGRE